MKRLLLLVLLGLTACASPPSRPVVLATDFGLQDDAVGLMRGVIARIAPGQPILDLTHQVPVFDVAAGARLIADAPGYYPPGSVFVVVVDPGVGTERRAVVARLANGSLVVAPDNGVLTEVIARHGPAVVRAITNRELVLEAKSATFHGRDVFAPVGAHLAAGVPFEQVGPVVEDWIRLESQQARRQGKRLEGRVVTLDQPFGNVWTDIPAEWLVDVPAGSQLEIRLGDGESLRIPWVRTFGEVPEGEPLAYPNSRGQLALALNMASFAEQFEVGEGMKLQVRLPE